jgi:hypothetical protein
MAKSKALADYNGEMDKLKLDDIDSAGLVCHLNIFENKFYQQQNFRFNFFSKIVIMKFKLLLSASAHSTLWAATKLQNVASQNFSWKSRCVKIKLLYTDY